jgi:hypothetical protein
MKYFIDEKEVSQTEFKEKIYSQCLINVSQKDKSIYQDYNKLTPFEMTLADNLLARNEAKQYENQMEFSINGFRFKREK